VATALRTLDKNTFAKFHDGEDCAEVTILNHVPYGHKFATRDIADGEEIIKYGEIIGRATQGIKAGCHTHIQNMESLRGRGDLEKAR
jgi:altronate dehydratase small subunit